MSYGFVFLIAFILGIPFGFLLCFFLVKTKTSREAFLEETFNAQPTQRQDDVFLGVK